MLASCKTLASQPSQTLVQQPLLADSCAGARALLAVGFTDPALSYNAGRAAKSPPAAEIKAKPTAAQKHRSKAR